ncbi:unnamed protein product, partial [Porites lobata]
CQSGFGASYAGDWIYGSFADTTSPLSRSITFKDLFAITAAVNTWAASLACRNILFHWDNLSIVHILSNRQVPGRLSCGFLFSNSCKTSTLGQLHVNPPNYFVGELSDSSHFTYNSAQRRFVHFSQDFSLVPLPASQETIILLATHLAQRIKPQSMNVYLAAVRSLHISHGLYYPLQPGLRLKQALRGIERKHFSAPK